MRRRDFIKVMGSAAAAWPLAGRAQQAAMAVIGFLRPTRAEDAGHLVAAVRQGPRQSGYPADKVTIESRWAESRPARLPKLSREVGDPHVGSHIAAPAGPKAAK